mmetsp:Transcript_22638/g.49454  ORF Transcript_22638/g.49454 Transcript_22638/m.49454 type:complete len:890 (-) Transcript_22638:340-3009(-)
MRRLVIVLFFVSLGLRRCLSRVLRLALCPKSIDNPFFDVSRDGCLDRAEALTEALQSSSSTSISAIECFYVGPSEFSPDGIEQARIVQEMMDHGEFDGYSISVTNTDAMRPVLEKAQEQGIPVVTFDSDSADTSLRSTYIGTDNYFFGQQLAKVLVQLVPTGGQYAIVTDSTPNIQDRERGARDILSDSRDDYPWTEIDTSPLDMKGNNTFAIQLMRGLLSDETQQSVTAIIPVMGGPMFLPTLWQQLIRDFGKSTTFVVGDGLPVQLDFLTKNKVDGLVAQLPYEMGLLSLDILTLLALEQQFKDSDAVTALAQELELPYTSSQDLPLFVGTNVLEHLTIPLVLPELIVDHNYLGSLSSLGYCLYGVVLCLAVAFCGWTYWNRRVRVVKVAQPGFLVMIASGVAILGAAMIPLGIDDENATNGQAICMSPIWLLFLGFTITFSALFAKLWRVNRLFQRSERFARSKVTSLDVLSPFIVLLTLNFAILLTWTLVDPLYFERRNNAGTDAWNRVIATYGTCVGDNAWAYVSPLVFLNGSILLVANLQAYRARNIQSEFSESKYVAMAVACLLQASLIGVPILFVVKDEPQAWYLSLVFIIFIVAITTLLLIFVPKIHTARLHSLRSESSQNRIIRQSIKASQVGMRQNRVTGLHDCNSSDNPLDEYSGFSASYSAPANQGSGSLRNSRRLVLPEISEDQEVDENQDTVPIPAANSPVERPQNTTFVSLSEASPPSVVEPHIKLQSTGSLENAPSSAYSGGSPVRRMGPISDLTESALSIEEPLSPSGGKERFRVETNGSLSNNAAVPIRLQSNHSAGLDQLDELSSESLGMAGSQDGEPLSNGTFSRDQEEEALAATETLMEEAMKEKVGGNINTGDHVYQSEEQAVPDT